MVLPLCRIIGVGGRHCRDLLLQSIPVSFDGLKLAAYRLAIDPVVPIICHVWPPGWPLAAQTVSLSAAKTGASIAGMANDNILFGDIAARGATMLEMRCGRCDRHGRLSVQRLLAQYGPDAAVRRAWLDRIADCPKRDSTQWYERCDPLAAVQRAQAAVMPGAGRWCINLKSGVVAIQLRQYVLGGVDQLRRGMRFAIMAQPRAIRTLLVAVTGKDPGLSSVIPP